MTFAFLDAFSSRLSSSHVAIPVVVAVALACAPAVSPDDGADDAPSNDDDTTPLPAGPAQFDYVEVDGAVCGNGTPVGLGYSAGVDDETLVVVLSGGGACWDNVSCFGLNAAAHLQDTYSADVMANDLAPALASGLLDRGDDVNPFTDAHLAFVPYCTGDLHAGTSTRQYQADLLGQDIRTVHHVGRINAAAFATTLAGRVPRASHVILVGLSAGGYGAMLDHDLFAAAFPRARIDVIADGAPLVPPQNGLYATWQNQWSMSLPEGCAGCDTEFAKVIEHLRTTRPTERFALLSTTNDETIRTYFGYGANNMTAQVNALVDAQYSGDNARAFIVTGTQHVILGGWRSFIAPSGVSMLEWLQGFVAGDDDAWVLVRP